MPTLKEGESKETAPLEPTADRQTAERLYLIVVSEGTCSTQRLPEVGEVSIGRSEVADVRIDQPWISRQHAVLHVGAKLRIQDLGSANGTSVRGERLEPGQAVDLAPGDAVDLGRSMLVVQKLSLASHQQRVWPHGSFMSLLERECARAAASGIVFAVVRIQAESTTSAREIETALADSLRAVDVVAAYGPGEYEVLVVDRTEQQAQELVGRIGANLAARSSLVRLGIACYPRDGRDPESLLARASGALLGEDTGRFAVSQAPSDDTSMRDLYRLVERVAAGTINVLLLGETGVGKEVVAERLHRMSPRASKPFLRLHCAALSETLLESELFGHERGAFTGAVQAKQGLLEIADGGTVFLDEVGELPSSIQVKLLRVIEEQQVWRVGSLKPRAIDIRFVSATNRDLENEVASSAFRRDLFFRLNGILIVVPPLRDRVSEIIPLAKGFVAHVCQKMGHVSVPDLAPEAIKQLQSYPWPGNVRELRNVMERAVLLCASDAITLQHLPVDKMDNGMRVLGDGASTSAKMAAPLAAPAPENPDERARILEEEVSENERKRILDALERSAGNQTRAAKLLGISRGTLMAWLDRYSLPRPRKKS